MAVTVLSGDLFQSKAQTLTNAVNCAGVMGKGIALAFKQRFPDMYADYVLRCERKEVQLGKPYVYKGASLPLILNFPTKDHWRDKSNLDSIAQGLDYLLKHYREWGIESLAVPALGAGLGQLEWGIVEPVLNRYLSRMDMSIELYIPQDLPH